MELLEQAKSLLKTLKAQSESLKDLKHELSGTNPASKHFENLYREEFRLMMGMSDTFDRLETILTKLSKDSEQSFLVLRLKTQAEAIVGGVDRYEF